MTTVEYNASVDLFSDNIYRFILKHTKDIEKSKDIVQESYVRLWQKVKEVKYETVKSYLFTISYRIMIDMYRKDKRMGRMEEVDSMKMSHDQQYSDLKEILDKAVMILPEIQRSVVLLRDYEGYSYLEIGQICNLKESQVKVYIYRARKTLRAYLVKMDVTL